MRIGYYAHHHGSGHCRQIDKLAALLPDETKTQLTVFTSLSSDAYAFTAIDEKQIVRLPPEDERKDDVLKGRAGQYWQPDCLHYSPIGNSDIQKRSHQILEAIDQRKIDLMIVDVSVEVAMLCRVASIPYLYVKLPGNRDDTPHLNAFAGALALIAPYPRSLESDMTPEWLSKKTLYLDFIHTKPQALTYPTFIKELTELAATTQQNHSNKKAGNLIFDDENTPTIVTVIKGYGGHKAIDMKLAELRRLLPNAFIISLGPIDDEMRHHVDVATQVDDVTPFMQHSDYLLMACGLNAVAQAYDYATPLVVLPDERPHQEQEVMAQALINQGRASSWQQFKHLIKNKNEQSNQNEVSIHQSTQTDDTLNFDDTILPQNRLSAAQEFINSMTRYSTTKEWFESWLLLNLELHPENLNI